MIKVELAFALSAIAITIATASGIAIARRYLPGHFLAVAQNERSNHSGTPRQFGGLVIVPVFFAGLYSASLFLDFPISEHSYALFSLLLLFLLGLVDDWKGLGVAVRLIGQGFCAFLLLMGSMGFISSFPQQIGLVLAAISVLSLMYWINIVNFMDGLDLLTFAGLSIPLATFAILLAGPTEELVSIGLLGAVGCGALVGFALHNLPSAKVFLGDSGSLFLGGLSAYLIAITALEVSPILAILPVLYYLMDASLTIFFRLIKRENILKSHSSHAYQIAYRKGKSPLAIAVEISLLNVLLAISTFLALPHSYWAQLFFLLAGVLICGALIWRFRRFEPEKSAN